MKEKQDSVANRIEIALVIEGRLVAHKREELDSEHCVREGGWTVVSGGK